MEELRKLNNLLNNTRAVLLKLINNYEFLCKYVLVGGSALSIHLAHRLSEDLDFFSYDDNFDLKEILSIHKSFNNFQILNQTNVQLDLMLDGVKVTFLNSNWEFLKPRQIKNFNLASVKIIASMKINTLFVRATYRDYYDLYYILKEEIMDLYELFQISKKIVKGFNFKLLAAALIYIDDIEDDTIEHLSPAIKISKLEIRNFFQKKIEEVTKEKS